MSKQFAGKAAASKKAAPPAQEVEQPAAPAAKAAYVPREGEIGDMTKNDKGTQLVKVVQDITLKAGDLLVFEPLDKTLASLVEGGFKTEEQAQEIYDKVGAWKLGRLKKLPARD